MARKLRADPPDGWHHVMNRGVDRQRIFVDDEDRIEFGRCLALACRRFGVELHAYCLMTNHFHLLLRCPEGHVSDTMHLACGLYARHFNVRQGRVGHLFGDRFCSRSVTSSDYIANTVRYIHRNPFDISGVVDPREYRWSSHPMYAGRRGPSDFMRTDVVLGWFESRAAFDSFVGRPHDAAPRRTSRRVTIDPSDLMQAVDLVIGERFPLSGRAVITQRRAIALRVDEACGGGSHDRLLVDLGIESPAARRAALARAERHLASEPRTRNLVAPVIDLVVADRPLRAAS